MGPLLSWDLFIERYDAKLAQFDDLKSIRNIAVKRHLQLPWNIEDLLLHRGKVILLTDPRLHIIFASSNMVAMNGYQPAEVLGKTPEIFQGDATDRRCIGRIRKAIASRSAFSERLINYHKNGTVYSCEIEAYPVFNTAGRFDSFIAFEKISV